MALSPGSEYVRLQTSKDTSEAWPMFFKGFFRQFVQAISLGTKFNNSDEFLYFGKRRDGVLFLAFPMSKLKMYPGGNLEDTKGYHQRPHTGLMQTFYGHGRMYTASMIYTRVNPPTNLFLEH